MKKLLVLLIVLALGIAAFVAYRPLKQADAEPTGYEFTPVEYGTLTEVVQPTGPVEPSAVTVVGTLSTGEVLRIPADVDYNKPVKKGQTLVELDTRLAETKVDLAKAAIRRAEAGVASAEATLRAAERNLSYQKQLFEDKVIQSAVVEKATLEHGAAEAAKLAAKSAVLEAKAGLAQAELGLSLMKVVVPCDGVILDRKVTVGQFVAPPASAHLFTIAHDLKKLDIHALVAEAEIGKVWPGQKATFTVATYSDTTDQTFNGTVKLIRNLPTNVQGATFYDTVIEADNVKDPKTGAWLLRPGMTASAIITCRTHETWKVPTQALATTIDLPLQTAEAQQKIQDLEKRKDKNDWKVIWVMGGGKNPGPDKKPWPIQVRVGGKNAAGETGIESPGFTEILEWDLEIAGRLDKKASPPLEVITEAPPGHKPSFFEKIKVPLG